MKGVNALTAIVLMAALTVSCSDNGTSSSDDGSLFGSITVDVSGAIEAQHECINSSGCVVSFGLDEFEILNTTFFTFSIDSGTFTTFLLDFNTTSLNEPISRPAAGTYTLGSGDYPSFNGGYSNIEQGRNDEFSFDTTENVGGTLIIETSTNERVTGIFEFDAIHIDAGDNRTVTITGTFEAVNMELLRGL